MDIDMDDGVQEQTLTLLQFALSYFLLFDAATLSSHAKPPPDSPHDVVPVHMSFVDWVPAICSTRTFTFKIPFVSVSLRRFTS